MDEYERLWETKKSSMSIKIKTTSVSVNLYSINGLKAPSYVFPSEEEKSVYYLVSQKIKTWLTFGAGLKNGQFESQSNQILIQLKLWRHNSNSNLTLIIFCTTGSCIIKLKQLHFQCLCNMQGPYFLWKKRTYKT